MIITDFISITELSRLTKKSRPTIYKYLDDFHLGNYDDIPYSIITLFKMAKTSTKAEIIAIVGEQDYDETSTVSE